MPARARNGVKLAYEEAGHGPHALVFIHGWCCDRSYFALQADHFVDRFRVLSLDLRGHGASDAPEQAYTVPGFAEDCDWLLGELGVERAALIGHSMGGLVALALAERNPARVAALAAVDSPFALPPELQESIRALTPALQSPDYKKLVRQFIAERLFDETDDLARRERVAERMSSRPQHVMVSAWQHMFEWDSDAALRTWPGPLLYVAAARPAADLARLRELVPQALIAQTAGAGHFNQLLVPDQVNAMLERFLQLAAKA